MSKVIKLSNKIKEKLRLEVVEIFDILRIDNAQNKKDSFFYEIKMRNRTLYYIYDDMI